MHLLIHIAFHRSIQPPMHLFMYLAIHTPIYPSISPYIYPCVHLPTICSSIHPFTHPAIHLSIHKPHTCTHPPLSIYITQHFIYWFIFQNVNLPLWDIGCERRSQVLETSTWYLKYPRQSFIAEIKIPDGLKHWKELLWDECYTFCMISFSVSLI